MKILVVDGVDKKAVEMLRKEYEVKEADLDAASLLKEIPEYHALMVRSKSKVTAEVIEAGKNLKVIGRAGAGVDNIDVPAATKKGIKVVNAPYSNSVSVAELVMGQIIALARKTVTADAHVRGGGWDRKTWMGIEISGKKLGIIGFGNIGQLIAERAKAFGMNILAYDPFMNHERAASLGVKEATLEELLKESDFISINAAKTKESTNMIRMEHLKMMKKNAYIINAARGGIVNEEDLADALLNGIIAGAAIDVFSEEPPKPDMKLLKVPSDKLILTHHLGANTKDAQIVAGIQCAEQVIKALKGEKIDWLVNKEVA